MMTLERANEVLKEHGFSSEVVEAFIVMANSKSKEHFMEAITENPEVRVSEVLKEIGIPASIKGYYFLREAIILVLNDPNLVSHITSDLYPAIAEKFKTKKELAERSIRHAIEVAWDRGDPYVLEKMFGNSVSYAKGRPTNSEFITMVVDVIRLSKY